MKGCAVKVRPECGGKVLLGVGHLPEQVVTQALFAAGTNQQVGVGQIGSVEMLGKEIGGDLLGAEAALSNQGRDRLTGMKDLLAAPVIGRDRKVDGSVAGSGLYGGLNFALEAGGKLAEIANKANAHPLGLHFGQF